MSILVTGAGGFIGRVLTLHLQRRGHDVVGLEHDSLDLTDAPAVHAWCRGFADASGERIDTVMHLAARSEVRSSFADPAGAWAVNVGGLANLLSALGRTFELTNVVFASTNAVYGPGYTGALSEDLAPQPSSPYAASKLAAEELLREQAASGLCGATVLRLFNVAGGWAGITDPNTTRIIGASLRTARGEQDAVRINGDGSAVRDFVHVRDVAEAFKLAAETTKVEDYRVFNVGSGVGTSMLGVVEAARRITGRSIPVVYGPAANEPQALFADTERVKAELGWAPRWSTIDAIVRDAWEASA